MEVKSKIFNANQLELIASNYTEQFYKFLNKQMNIFEAEDFASSFVRDIFRTNFELKDLNKNNEPGYITEGCYYSALETIVIDRKVFAEMLKKGNLLNFLITTFHEGTHALQNKTDKLDFYSLKSYSTEMIEFFLKSSDPKLYDQLSKENNFEIRLKAASKLSYLNLKHEQEARLCAYENIKALLEHYKNVLNITADQYDARTSPRLTNEKSYYYDSLSNFANESLPILKQINSKYENFHISSELGQNIYDIAKSSLENLDTKDFSKTLIKNNLFFSNFPNLEILFSRVLDENLSVEQLKNKEHNASLISSYLHKHFPVIVDSICSCKDAYFFNSIFEQLSDEKLFELYDHLKNYPFDYNKTISWITFNVKNPNLLKKITNELMENRCFYLLDKNPINTAISNITFKGTENPKDTINFYNKLIDKGLETGQYRHLSEINEEISLLGTLKDVKQTHKIYTKNKIKFIKAGKKELKSGFLSKKGFRSSDFSDIEFLFIKIGHVLSAKAKKVSKQYMDLPEMKSQESDYFEDKKINDYSKFIFTKKEVEKEFNFKHNKNTKTLSKFLNELVKYTSGHSVYLNEEELDKILKTSVETGESGFTKNNNPDIEIKKEF